MSPAHNYTYATAREAFLERTADAELTSYEHPLAGPDGEIAMDVAYWPNQGSDKVVVISSGTHGIEGYCGSFIQCALIDQSLGEKATENSSLMMVHGVNPYGFAWQRRVNEDNIDMNRNFVDHSKTYPINEGYAELAQLLEPETWDDSTEGAIKAGLRQLVEQHADDPRWMQAAMSGGQYAYPHGQFYGGNAEAWSNRKVRELSTQFLFDKEVVWIDIHTALGEYATAQCIVEIPPGSPQLDKAVALWGDLVGNTMSGESVATEVTGTMVTGVKGDRERSTIVTGLEFGTVNPGEVSMALLQDQWLHRYGDLNSEAATMIKQRMMDAFYPDDEEWRSAVLGIANDVIAAAVAD